MKLRILRFKIPIVLCVGLVTTTPALHAQQLTSQNALGLVKNNAASLGLSRSDLSDLRISSAYNDKSSGASLVYVQQTYKGVDVYNAIQTYAFKNNKLASVSGQRISNIDQLVTAKVATASVTPANAVNTAASHLRLNAVSAVAKQINGTKDYEFGNLNVSSVNVKARLLWVPDELTGKLSLAWQVEIQPKGRADYWLVNVDAQKNVVLSKFNLNIACDWTHPVNGSAVGTYFNSNNLSDKSADDEADKAAATGSKYRVVPYPAESPNHPGGTPIVKVNPWELVGAGNNATTLQWNSDGVTNYDSTRGNNVLAQEDANGNNGFGLGAVSTTPYPNLTFNFVPNFKNPPNYLKNQAFNITNLFYWNNTMHDITYQYGFDEPSGNFQANNLGRGGNGNDYVFADAQDGSGTNNANFATPSDGSNPRMQMFLFNAVPNFIVNQPTAFAGNKTATESGFSTANKIADKGPITNFLVLYNDNAGGTTHEGCAAPANASALAGKIAVIDRGTCSFTVKVKNAQNAGAIGAVVIDNIPGEYPIVMGGTDNTITAPAVMVGFETGDTIKQYLAASTPVKITMKKGVQLDGDADAGVMCHEYTHGISNRLTGGPSNVSCLQNKEQMGEGWSDYLGLMMTTNWKTATVTDGPNKRPIGTYVLGQSPDGAGIRYYPYSTDLSANPWTYDSLALSSRFSNGILTLDPHTVGEVWCNMLWVMTWDLIQARGINKYLYHADVAKGNSIALNLVITGMKLQKCSPGFVDGRDGILKADTLLYNGKYSALIWKSFASRGLGYSASEGNSNNVKDGTAAYDLPPGVSLAKTETVSDAAKQVLAGVSISPNPANSYVNVTVGGNKKALTVDLLNTNGQQIKRYNMNGESLQINLPKLASGMYYIKISGEGVSETRKLMIQ